MKFAASAEARSNLLCKATLAFLRDSLSAKNLVKSKFAPFFISESLLDDKKRILSSYRRVEEDTGLYAYTLSLRGARGSSNTDDANVLDTFASNRATVVSKRHITDASVLLK